MEYEAGEAGQLAGIGGGDPGRECGAEAGGEDLAEVADMPGDRVRFGAAGQDVLQGGAVVFGQRGGVSGSRRSAAPRPVSARISPYVSVSMSRQ